MGRSRATMEGPQVRRSELAPRPASDSGRAPAAASHVTHCQLMQSMTGRRRPDVRAGSGTSRFGLPTGACPRPARPLVSTRVLTLVQPSEPRGRLWGSPVTNWHQSTTLLNSPQLTCIGPGPREWGKRGGNGTGLLVSRRPAGMLLSGPLLCRSGCEPESGSATIPLRQSTAAKVLP